MTDEVPHCTEVMRHVLREREGLPYQSGDTLALRSIEPLNVGGVARFLCDGFVPLGGNHPCVDLVLIRREDPPAPGSPPAGLPTIASRCHDGDPHVGFDRLGLG